VWLAPQVLQVLQELHELQPLHLWQFLWPQPDVNNRPNVATNTVAILDRPISLDDNAKTRMVDPPGSNEKVFSDAAPAAPRWLRFRKGAQPALEFSAAK
jgi:hypothetical protein